MNIRNILKSSNALALHAFNLLDIYLDDIILHSTYYELLHIILLQQKRKKEIFSNFSDDEMNTLANNKMPRLTLKTVKIFHLSLSLI